MVAPRIKAKPTTISYWLPDPADLKRLVDLLKICGYTDERMAREEVEESVESEVLFEVTIRTCEVLEDEIWYEDPRWGHDLQEGVWQA